MIRTPSLPRFETLISAMPLLVIALVIYAFYVTSAATERHEALIRLTDQIVLNVNHAHNQIEEATFGDQSVELERDILRPLDEAQTIIQALRNGGQTSFGVVAPVSDFTIRTNLAAIETRIQVLRAISGTRWENRDTSGPGTQADRAYDAVYDTILDLSSATLTDRDALIERAQQQMEVTRAAIILFLILLFMGLVVTERRNRQAMEGKTAAVAQERKLLRALIDNVPDFIYFKDTEGRFLVANQSLAHTFGLDAPDALIGKTNHDFLPQELADQFHAGEMMVLASEQPVLNVEHLAYTHAGAPWWMATTKVPLRNEEGKIIGLVGVGRDISERKRAGEALARLAAIVETSDDAIISKTLDGTIVTWNAGAERLLGYTAEEVVGQPSATVVPQNKLDEEYDILARVGRGERLHQFETQRAAKDGTLVDVSLTISPIQDANNKIIAISFIARDITQRKVTEARLLALFAAMRDVILVLDGDGRYLEVAPNSPQFLMLPPDQMIGKTLHDLFPSEKADFILGAIRQALETRQMVNVEYSVPIHDKNRWFSTNISPMLEDRVLLVARDLTSRKETEEAMRQNDARYRSLIETSPDAIMLMDLETNILISNQQSAQMVGLETTEQIVGKKGLDLIVPEDRAGAMVQMQQLFERGTVRNVEYRLLAQDGRYVPVEASASVTFAPDGQPQGILLISRDVTERKQAQKALHESEARFATAFRASPVAMALTSLKEGRYLDVNEVFTHVIGYGREEVLGRVATDLNIYATPEDRATLVTQLREHGHVRDAEIKTRIKTGEVRDVLVSVEVIEIGGEQALLSSFYDITERKQMEEALRESEEKYRSILETTTEWVWATDLNGNLTYSNPAVQGILGYTVDEILKQGGLLIHEEDRQQIARLVPQLIAAKRGWNGLVLRWRHKDGSYRYLESNSTPVFDDNGNVVGHRGADRDITARRRAEEALRYANERFQAVAQATNDAVWDLNLETNSLWWNEGLQILFGYPPDTVTTDAEWAALVHPDDIGRIRASVDAVVASGEQYWTSEYRFRRSDGSYAYVLDRGFIIHDERGKPSRMIGSILDLTERRATEEELRENKKRLDQAQQLSHLGSWEWDVKRNELIWSDELYRIFGLEPQVRPATFEMYTGFIHADDQVRLGETIQNALRTHQSYQIEHRFIRNDGAVRLLLGQGEIVTDATGEPVKMLGVAQDVTERKQAEAELQRAKEAAEAASRAKSEFLANMSHEIRTPMNGVIGMTGLLLDTELDTEQQRYAETVRFSAERLLTIINDILDFSKIEAGKLDLETTPFDVRTLVEEVADLLAESAQAKGLEFASLVELDVPPMVQGDPGRLRQVLVNLVSNAVKFTKQGEVVVRCKLIEEAGTAVVLGFEVTDTGIGMTPAEQERLFKPFSQADSSTTRQYGGTGLGLAISYQLVEMLGGEMGAHSEKDQGSTFWFTVPLAQADVPPALPARAELAGLRVLVVDDNATNREILHHQLSGWKLLADSVEDGRAALERLRAAAEQGAPYDLAILDLHMPLMDGIELAWYIKGDAALAEMPLIMLSSVSQRSVAREAMEAHISAYLTKPVRQSEFYNSLLQVMNVRPRMEFADGLSSETPQQPEPFQGHARILVAEDNPVNQVVATRMLEKRGYRVDVVANGLEAVEALAQIPYAAVLMDCQMPEMDGYEATLEIRRREAGVHRVPIIAMTAHAMQGDREKCLAVGMDDYVAKPVQAEVLEAVLNQWVPLAAWVQNGSSSTSNGNSAKRAESVLDAAIIAGLHELADGEPEILVELVGIFLSDAAERMATLGEAVAHGEAKTIERVAHSLKGSSGNFGARGMASLCGELEQQARCGDLDGAPDRFAHLQAEWAQVADALRAELL